MSLLSTNIANMKRLSLRGVKLRATESEIELITLDNNKIKALVKRVIMGERSYSKQDIVIKIMEANNISSKAAERVFTIILQAGAIESTPSNRYFLADSTPF